jgi:hypothetical protein
MEPNQELEQEAATKEMRKKHARLCNKVHTVKYANPKKKRREIGER